MAIMCKTLSYYPRKLGSTGKKTILSTGKYNEKKGTHTYHYNAVLIKSHIQFKKRIVTLTRRLWKFLHIYLFTHPSIYSINQSYLCNKRRYKDNFRYTKNHNRHNRVYTVIWEILNSSIKKHMKNYLVKRHAAVVVTEWEGAQCLCRPHISHALSWKPRGKRMVWWHLQKKKKSKGLSLVIWGWIDGLFFIKSL